VIREKLVIAPNDVLIIPPGSKVLLKAPLIILGLLEISSDIGGEIIELKGEVHSNFYRHEKLAWNSIFNFRFIDLPPLAEVPEIVFRDTGRGEIKGCRLLGVRIVCQRASPVITRNIFIHHQTPILLYKSQAVISYNLFLFEKYFSPKTHSLVVEESSAKIRNNFIIGWNFGICGNDFSGQIEKNLICQNEVGIYFDGKPPRIIDNLLAENKKWGILGLGGSEYQLRRNDFINNRTNENFFSEVNLLNKTILEENYFEILQKKNKEEELEERFVLPSALAKVKTPSSPLSSFNYQTVKQMLAPIIRTEKKVAQLTDRFIWTQKVIRTIADYSLSLSVLASLYGIHRDFLAAGIAGDLIYLTCFFYRNTPFLKTEKFVEKFTSYLTLLLEINSLLYLFREEKEQKEIGAFSIGFFLTHFFFNQLGNWHFKISYPRIRSQYRNISLSFFSSFLAAERNKK
jgi:hypothetical protein